MPSRPSYVLGSSVVAVGVLALLSGACRGPDDAMAQAGAGGRHVGLLLESGRYAEAHSSAEVLLEDLRTRIGDAPSEALAVALDALVEARWRNGDASTDTLSKAEQVLQWRRAQSNGTATALSLRNLGRVLFLAGRADEAVKAFQASLDGLGPLVGPNDVVVADALDALASGLMELARYGEAEPALQRALQLRQASNISTGPALAHTLELLGLASLRTGRYSQARAPLERALAIRRAQPRHPETANTLALLGDLLWFEGRPAEARDAYQQCVSIRESALRENHPDIALCTRRLGNALAILGDMSGALALFERAAGIAERSLGAGHPLLAGYLNGLAEAHRTLMDFRSARALYERALNILERHVDTDRQDVATVVYNLALVASELGDLPEARRQFDRAVALWRDRHGADHPFVAMATASLAQTLLRHGREDEALLLQRQVLAIRERSLGPDHLDTASTLGDLASTLLARGRNAEAAGLSARAIGIWERRGAPDSPGFSSALALRGTVVAVSGDLSGARAHYTRALTIAEQVFGPDHPSAADLRVRLAAVERQAGHDELALEQALAAEHAARRFFLLTLRYLPEREALSYALWRPSGLNLVLSLAVAAGRTRPADVRPAMDAVVNNRGLVFGEIAARRKMIGAVPEPGLAAPWADWVSARQRLANLAVRDSDTRRSSGQLMLLQEARREADKAERALAERSASFRSEREKTSVRQSEIQDALPKGSALVSYVRYDRVVDVMSTVIGSKQAVASYLAFILSPASKGPIIVPLGPASSIDPAIAEWRTQVTPRMTRTTSSAAADRGFRSLGDLLRQRIWDPLEPHLQGSSRIFIVPDGALHMVNLAALPIGTSQYLLDRAPPIHYLTTERDLVLFGKGPSTRAEGLMALGGPSFDVSRTTPSSAPADVASARSNPRAGCESLQSVHFSPLPGTLGEVQEVAQYWHAVEGPASRPVSLLTGAAASERAFKMQAPGHRVLHMATHGFFLGGDCAVPSTGRRSVAGLVSAAGRGAFAADAESPLLRTGLALAGANQRTRAMPNDEDGILTAEEVATLNLDGVEWAVLSACDTGLGEIRAGEGVFGLRRAFQVAGVRTVIMSLWSVEDQATRQWMRALYEARLERGLDTADSVRAAALSVLNDRRAKGQSTHPFYWAAFVAAGDWR